MNPMYSREFVITFGDLARKYRNIPLEELFDHAFEATEATNPEAGPPEQQQNIFFQVMAAAAEMCNVTMAELESGNKYGDIPTVKQLTSKILSELEFSQKKIAVELPMLGKRNAIQQQVTAANKYAKSKKSFRVVLEQLREKFLLNDNGVK